MYFHNYTTTLTDTAAVTVNAGTCLEDGNFHSQKLNVFDNIKEAMDEVNNRYCLVTESSSLVVELW